MSDSCINNKERGKQLVTFSGLTQGKLSASDLDGWIEYKDKGYMLFEIKVSGVDLPFGQRIGLERMADDLGKVKPTIFIVAEHGFPVEEEIIANCCTVKMYRAKGEWHIPQTVTTLGQIACAFMETLDK